MLKKSRLYFSAMIAVLVLFSLLITPNIKACEDIPQTLLSLYMNSDLVVLAKYESDGNSKKSDENEYGYSLEIERNLSVVKIIKGQNDSEIVSFTSFEYRPNPNQPVSTTDSEDIYDHNDDDYFDISKIKIGGQYLFFLSKDRETGKYGVADYSSGVKDVAGKSDIYEKNLNELTAITGNKENQLAKLTEWIVKNIEEPEFREDGINDLAESFYGSDEMEESQKINSDEPFIISEDYKIYTAGVAKNLTDSQKARISSVLYPLLQESWFAAKPQYVNYGIPTILSAFNKSRLAIYAFNMVQSVDKQDSARKRTIMEFLANVVGDSNLSDVFYKYSELEYKIDEVKTKNSPEAKKQLKIMTETRNIMLKDFDKRFRFMFDRNFVPVEDTKVIID